jgi:hypothetical protein
MDKIKPAGRIVEKLKEMILKLLNSGVKLWNQSPTTLFR